MSGTANYYDLSSTLYMAWNRIEGRPRKKQFDQVLRAEIHDPLWMLGRQWQMGEFTANDTGSGIFARLQLDYTTINGFSAYGATSQAYSQLDMPLEPIVERVNYKWSIKETVLMGKKWLGFLEAQLIAAGSANFATYKAALLATTDLIIDLDKPVETDPEAEIILKSETFADKKVYSFLSGISLVNNIIDGGKLFNLLNNAGTSSAGLSVLTGSPYGLSFNTADTTAVTNAITAYVQWVRKMYTLPATPPPGLNVNEHWGKERMEYKFDTYFPTGGTTPAQRRLSVDEYHEGSFDWHAFMQHDNNPGGSNVTVKSMQVLMSEARFAGMPNSRWWEFENGGVNFCQIDANTTDIAKIVMTQFALVYQDDWFVVPYKVPVGSYSNVRGIVVTDVFGIRTFVKNHTTTYSGGQFVENNASWKTWRWMDIGVYSPDKTINTVTPAGKLLIPPVCSRKIEGKPLESVTFMRDEMANMVWAIEKTVPNKLGRGMGGSDKAYAVLDYLKTIKPDDNDTILPEDPDAKAMYKIVSTDMPENWIPFIPVASGTAAVKNRSIQLQRAAMPRMLPPYTTALVRPRTEILRYGIDNNNLSVDPLFINEEEVPRAGAIVETSFQRCRWYDGKIFTWIGRRKITGRGEGYSNLTYDKVEDVPGT